MGFYQSCQKCCNNTYYWIGSLVLLVMRLYWGVLLAMHGWEKIMNIPETMEFFKDLGIIYPGYVAYLVGYIEFIGGILLAAGFLARLASIPIIALMILMYSTEYRTSLLGIFSDPEAFISAQPFMFLLTSLLVFSFGTGCCSLSNLLFRQKS